MPRTLPLNLSATAVLDASGNGTSGELGPSASGETWNVTLLSLRASTNVSEAVASVYLNGALIGTTTWGSTGDSDTGISLSLAVGQVLTAQWSGGDAGATGTLTAIGTRTV